MASDESVLGTVEVRVIPARKNTVSGRKWGVYFKGPKKKYRTPWLRVGSNGWGGLDFASKEEGEAWLRGEEGGQ